MTPDDLRRLALSQPKTVEVYRGGRSEFLVLRKSVASLEGPADSIATIQLTSEQRAIFMHVAPQIFLPLPGDWNRFGVTKVALAYAYEAIVESALAAAWRNIVPSGDQA